MSFQKLLDELNELQEMHKSMTAAGVGGDEGDEGEEEEDDGDGDEAALGKSFTAEIDGKKVEAIDGTELVKSLMAKVDGIETQLGGVMTPVVDLIKQQGEMIKSLQAEVIALGSRGRGRQSVVSVAERKAAGIDLTKSEGQGMDAGEFMAKALTAQRAGRITGMDIARVEARLNAGLEIPKDLIQRVLD